MTYTRLYWTPHLRCVEKRRHHGSLFVVLLCFFYLNVVFYVLRFILFCFYYSLNVHEIISALEDDNLTISADIFITPPENDDLSDEDSGSEEAVEISNLGRRQLSAEADVRRTVSSLEGILENVEGFDQEEEVESQPHLKPLSNLQKKLRLW